MGDEDEDDTDEDAEAKDEERFLDELPEEPADAKE